MKRYTTKDLANPEMKLAIEFKGDLVRLNSIAKECYKDVQYNGTSKFYWIRKSGLPMSGENPPEGYTAIPESEILLMSEAEEKPKIKKGTVMVYNGIEVVFVGYNKKDEKLFKGVVIKANNHVEIGEYQKHWSLEVYKPKTK